MDQSIQKIFYFILKTEALVVARCQVVEQNIVCTDMERQENEDKQINT